MSSKKSLPYFLNDSLVIPLDQFFPKLGGSRPRCRSFRENSSTLANLQFDLLSGGCAGGRSLSRMETSLAYSTPKFRCQEPELRVAGSVPANSFDF